MSNVSPQQVAQRHRASGAPASKAPSRAKPLRVHGQARGAQQRSCALVTIQMRRSIRLCCSASKQEHGAEAPRKSKLRSSLSAIPRIGTLGSSRAMQFTRALEKIGRTVSHCGEGGHLEQRGNASKYKCGSITPRQWSASHVGGCAPMSSASKPSRLGSARCELRANPSIEGTCNIWLRQLSPAPHVKRWAS